MSEEEVEQVVKVNKYDNAALKQALDDAVTKYMTEELDYEEDYGIINSKIVLGSIGCILALIAQFYPAPFPENKLILILCAVGYFTCSSILQYIISFVQKDYFLFATHDKETRSVAVASQMKKYSPDYTLIIKYKDAKEGEQITKPVTAWFDEDGVLVTKLFVKDVQALLNQLVQKSKKKSN